VASYLECRSSIYQHVTFTICSIPTAYDFFVRQQNPICDEIRFLNVSFVLPASSWTSYEEMSSKPKNPWHQPELDMWDSLRVALGRTECLVEANIWVECFDSVYREFLRNTPVLFELIPETSSKFIFSLPVPDNELLEKLEQAGIQISRRPEPEFYGHLWLPTTVGKGEGRFYGPRITTAGSPRPPRIHRLLLERFNSRLRST
jgi:hypothetical protein